jgi:uracil DNA glycosylase
MFVHSIEPSVALGVESPHPIGVSMPAGWLKYVAFKDINQWMQQRYLITIVNLSLKN